MNAHNTAPAREVPQASTLSGVAPNTAIGTDAPAPAGRLPELRRALAKAWLFLIGRTYRPEKHYMRGPRKAP